MNLRAWSAVPFAGLCPDEHGLRWHVERLENENERRARRAPHLGRAMAASELLFPPPPTKWNHGGLRSQSCLSALITMMIALR